MDPDHARTTSTSSRRGAILDEDHFDLEKVKDRIVEYLAVSKLKGDVSGPILCFVGPPGVGKTSLGQSIARTLGRKFVRISVGGVRDEAEIRGHRRTYIGAMPGTIIRALRDAESKNPVFLIDEIDKMGADWRGDPSSAMLEVLDPEQNSSFRDHYLDLPFDLSKVLFICTANQLETIPGPLLDRMDVIQLSGYTEEEKLQIAKRYLVPKQLEAHGLTAEQVEFGDDALRLVIREYTREAGLRNLERRIADVLPQGGDADRRGEDRAALRVDEAFVREALGPRALLRRGAQAHRRPRRRDRARGHSRRRRRALHRGDGRTPATGSLQVTGQLGDVMQESAQAALSWVRSHARRARDRPGVVREARRPHPRPGRRRAEGRPVGGGHDGDRDRLARHRPHRSPTTVGMTGEITLTGQVLPIGGVREKVLAAQRAGLDEGDPPARERGRPGRAPGRDARRRSSSSSPTTSTRCSRPRSPTAGSAATARPAPRRRARGRR